MRADREKQFLNNYVIAMWRYRSGIPASVRGCGEREGPGRVLRGSGKVGKYFALLLDVGAALSRVEEARITELAGQAALV